MAVSASDIEIYLTGAESNGGAQTDPDAALGNYRSSTLKNDETAIDDGDGISDSDATITVDSTTDFSSSGYITIEDEVISYTGKTGVSFTGCTRGALDTTAAAHDDNTPVLELNLESLYDHVTGTEASSGDTEYRCFCVKNAHATDTAYNVKVYIAETTGNAEDAISFAVEMPAEGSETDGAAQTIANESTEPTVNSGRVSAWSTATSRATGVGTDQDYHDAHLDAGELAYVWVRRVVSASASAANNERYGIAVAFDTAA